MESKTKVAGHAAHPILIVFPLGLLSVAAMFDGLFLATKKKAFATTADQNLGAGVVSGVVAAVPGLIDWLAIPNRTRAKSIGLWHAGVNVAVLALATLSWLARRSDPEAPGADAIGYSLAAAGLGVVGGWLGGELVHRLAVSVDEGANLDAPNSLTGPAAPVDNEVATAGEGV